MTDAARSLNVLPRKLVAAASALVLAALAPGHAGATLPSDLDKPPGSATLEVPPPKHWVWVNDFVFPHMSDGLAHLVNADTGKYLGMLSTGYSARIVLPRDGRVIYSPETYFSRGTRGVRTDVVSIYDSATLSVTGEIAIPPKRASNSPNIGNSILTDDDRFLVIYNFTPAQSLTVVDTTKRSFAGEIETPGCALAYPTGARSFFSMCADGSLLTTEVDESGKVAKQSRSAVLFDVDHDPVTERPARIGDTWYFVTYAGRIYPVHFGKSGPELAERWWLSTKAERTAGWRPGGIQQIAIHRGSNRLYAIVHQGGPGTHKDPGKTLWIYDLQTRKRVQAMTLRHLATSVELSKDEHPLLYTVFADSSILDVYDPVSGQLLRSIPSVGTTPTILVTP
jgi:methylamine dehydrogenase heavy chain